MCKVEERLVDLFSVLGLNTDRGTFTRAEIKGYCAGIEAAHSILSAAEKKIFSADRDEYKPPQDYTGENFTAALAAIGGSYSVIAGTVEIQGVAAADLTEMWHTWGYPFTRVICSGSGPDWNLVDSAALSWSEIDRLALIWEMIETMEVNNE